MRWGASRRNAGTAHTRIGGLARWVRRLPGCCFCRGSTPNPRARHAAQSVAPSFKDWRVHRRYSDRPVEPKLIRLICALALSAPSKSDLQQRDIVVITDPGLRQRIAAFLPHMPWVREAPAFLVFCANGARLPEIARLRGKPFANDHLDLFFNATADAAIALATAIRAAEAMGLGRCPISEIRNNAQAVSDWLALPERVIPFAGFCLGWPAEGARSAHACRSP